MYSNKKTIIIFAIAIFLAVSIFSFSTYKTINSKVNASSNAVLKDVSPTNNSLINKALDDLLEAQKILKQAQDNLNAKQLILNNTQVSVIKSEGYDWITETLGDKDVNLRTYTIVKREQPINTTVQSKTEEKK